MSRTDGLHGNSDWMEDEDGAGGGWLVRQSEEGSRERIPPPSPPPPPMQWRLRQRRSLFLLLLLLLPRPETNLLPNQKAGGVGHTPYLGAKAEEEEEGPLV